MRIDGVKKINKEDLQKSKAHMAGIAQEETPTQKMLLFSSTLMTSRPSGDTFLNPYDTNI